MNTVRNGRIIIQSGANPLEKELQIAKVLITTGYDVEFLPESGLHAPDIKYMNKYWEIKRPEGNGKRTIQHQLQRAVLQSHNIIIDTSGTKMPIQTIISRVNDAAKVVKAVKRVVLITKKGKILTILSR